MHSRVKQIYLRGKAARKFFQSAVIAGYRYTAESFFWGKKVQAAVFEKEPVRGTPESERIETAAEEPERTSTPVEEEEEDDFCIPFAGAAALFTQEQPKKEKPVDFEMVIQPREKPAMPTTLEEIVITQPYTIYHKLITKYRKSHDGIVFENREWDATLLNGRATTTVNKFPVTQVHRDYLERNGGKPMTVANSSKRFINRREIAYGHCADNYMHETVMHKYY